MDLARILDNENIPRGPHPQVPELGLLTRTIVRSPVVKSMFPARIRHEDKNDVIVVHEHYVELKQLVGNRLRTVSVKNDFDATIRAARILGEPRKLVSSPNKSESDFEDTVFKEEDEEDEGDDRASNGSTMDIDSEPPQQLPPQILALTLRSGNASRLMFLFAQDQRASPVQFLSSTFELPGHSKCAGRPDAHIAVDPRSLALAVAAQNDVLILCSLKSREQLRHETQQDGRLNMETFNPIKEQYQLSLSGSILKMEFLHPPKDPALHNLVWLVVVVCTVGHTRIRLFEWDSTFSIREVKDKFCPGFPIMPDSRNKAPSQLITSTNYCGFILTFDTFMLTFFNLHTGYSQPNKFKYLQDSRQPGRLASSCEGDGAPGIRYWTAWARPARNKEFRKNNDCLYLGREDGVVSFLNISSHEGHTERHDIGRVNVSIDTGFASLDLGGSAFHNGGYDVLAIAGNSSDGGLFGYKARATADPLPQTLHNWAPILDWTAVPLLSSAVSMPTHQPASLPGCRIFACSGYGMRHGKIAEIRCGVEAHCISECSLDDLGAGRPTRLWLLTSKPNDDQHHSTILLSYPGGGSEMFLVDSQGKVEKEMTDPTLDELIDTGAETLAAAVTLDEFAVQVTEGSVRAISVHHGSSHKLGRQDFPARIIHASIEGRTSTCLICLATNERPTIHHVGIFPREEGPYVSLLSSFDSEELRSGVTSIALCNLFKSTIALIGTVDGKLVLCRSEAGEMKWKASYRFRGESAICESVCPLQLQSRGRTGLRETFLLCGLRNGSVHLLRLRYYDGVVSLTLHRDLWVGHSAVWVFPEHAHRTRRLCYPGSAIISCQNMLFRLSIDNRHLSLSRVWALHSGSHMLPSSPIFAVGQFQTWSGRHAFSKAICYIDDRAVRLMIADSSRITTTISHQTKLNGMPRRVIFARSINKLVVAYEELVVCTPGQHGGGKTSAGGRQFMFSRLRLLDPDVDLDTNTNEEGLVVGLSGDRITGMLEWTPELNHDHWRLLVVSTSRKREQEGCIYIYRLDNRDGKPPIKLQKEIPRGEPVYSIAAVEKNSIIYGCGNRLEIIQLVASERGFTWDQPSHMQIDLSSPARALSVSGQEINVSTALHSHLTCTFEHGQLALKWTDYKTRYGLDNVHLGRNGHILFGSDAHGGVCGLWHADSDHQEPKLYPVFEAHMISPIYRLQSSASYGNNECTALGASMNGSFHLFDVLSTAHWRLLRFVQNVIDRHPSICPATHMDNKRRHVEPGTGPTARHVNGDILARLFEQRPSGAAFLQAMMEKQPLQTREYDFESAEVRIERFHELMNEAFPNFVAKNAYEMLMNLLEEKLHPMQ